MNYYGQMAFESHYRLRDSSKRDENHDLLTSGSHYKPR